MARKRKNRNNRRRQSNQGGSNQIRVACKFYSQQTFSAGAAVISINPAAFPQAAQLADTYAMYRVTKLRYRFHVSDLGSPPALTTAVYIPGVTDNAPASSAIIMLIPYAAFLDRGAVLPGRWASVPRAVLSSYLPWLKTIVGSPDPAEETQGNVYLRGGSTDTYSFEMEATFEFKDLLSTSVTPMERGKRECVEARERLLRLLGTPAPAQLPSTTKSP